MADSFHFNISIISRGKGKSAVASAAYISCEKLTNEWDGVTHNYHNKKGLWHKEIFLPENAPKEFLDRSTLWNSVELNERAINAQACKKLHYCPTQRVKFGRKQRPHQGVYTGELRIQRNDCRPCHSSRK